MTLHELIERVKLRNPPFKIRLYACDGDRALAVEAIVSDRDTGNLKPIVIESPWPWRYDLHGGDDVGAQLRFVRDCIRRMFMHEIDECFHFDDARVFDPRKGEPK